MPSQVEKVLMNANGRQPQQFFPNPFQAPLEFGGWPPSFFPLSINLHQTIGEVFLRSTLPLGVKGTDWIAL